MQARMDEYPFQQMVDYLSENKEPSEIDSDIFSESEYNTMTTTPQKVPRDLQLMNELIDDPEFWKTLLNDDDVRKSASSKYSHLDCDPSLWTPFSCGRESPFSNCSMSSGSSEQNGSSPSHYDASELSSVVSATSSVTQNDTSAIDVDGSSGQLDCIVPSVSNYESPVSTIELGADVVVVTSEELIEETVKEQEADNTAVQGFISKTLQLSEEEKKLMEKEGVVLPTHLPLTKAEERELKRIRRKIRNKQSAQNSRKRKKEYIDGLEKRVKRCTAENNTLRNTIRELQERNGKLVAELERLHKIVSSYSNKSVQSSTCLMVVLFSCALFLLPNLLPSALDSKELFAGENKGQKLPPVAGRSRTLLYSSDVWDKGRAGPSFREDNVSNLYESTQASPKHGKWGVAAGQPVEKASFVFSDAAPAVHRKFSFHETKQSPDPTSPFHSSDDESINSPPSCHQEIIVESVKE